MLLYLVQAHQNVCSQSVPMLGGLVLMLVCEATDGPEQCADDEATAEPRDAEGDDVSGCTGFDC